MAVRNEDESNPNGGTQQNLPLHKIIFSWPSPMAQCPNQKEELK